MDLHSEFPQEQVGDLYLLPSRGRSTQRYRNIQDDARVRLLADGQLFDGLAHTITDTDEVRHVIRQFKEQYSERSYTNFYSDRVDVAVIEVLQ